MSVEISAKPRPIIPYEHPDAAMYYQLFKQHMIRQWHKKRPYGIHDMRLQSLFQDPQISLQHLCDYLVRYVAEAFEHYAVWDHTHAYYPGRPSQQNARIDALEGVSRVLPILAAWLRNQPAGKGRMVDLKGGTLDIAAILKQAFLAGTDPAHRGYWGVLHDYDQRICESADLALALWLCRQSVWDHFTPAQQQQVSRWFNQVSTVQTVDNNWHLFPLTVQFVMRALNGFGDVSAEKYQRIKEFQVGGGWFRDGARGNYDYYNAWGFHYSLYWLDQIDPEYDRQFIRSCMAEFVSTYRYLITPQGIPFLVVVPVIVWLFQHHCWLLPAIQEITCISEKRSAHWKVLCVILLAMAQCVLVRRHRDYLLMMSAWSITTAGQPVAFGHCAP